MIIIINNFITTDGSYMTNQGCYDRRLLNTRFDAISIANPNPITCSQACANNGKMWAAVRYIVSKLHQGASIA